MTKTWEEIRDEVAGMLADGQPLEDIISKLEQRKNEMAKAELMVRRNTMVTHRQALEAAKTLSEYCDTRESCKDGDCIFCDIQDVCLAYSMSDREVRIITKETERLERKGQDNDSVQR